MPTEDGLGRFPNDAKPTVPHTASRTSSTVVYRDSTAAIDPKRSRQKMLLAFSLFKTLQLVLGNLSVEFGRLSIAKAV